MLGHDVLRAGERASHEPIGLTREELDISDRTAVDSALERSAPQALINCAAYTDVDGAQEHADLAHAVNSDGAANLARAAARARIPLLHVSSDYVFSGVPQRDADGRPRPYVESDEPAPQSVYGQSKLAGERHVLDASAEPRRRAQLVALRHRWAQLRRDDAAARRRAREHRRRRRPGRMPDMDGAPRARAHRASRARRGGARSPCGRRRGLAGTDSRARSSGRPRCPARSHPTSTAAMGRPAPRPAYSALASERDDVLPMPPWQDGLAGYLAARAGMIRAWRA